MTKENKAKLTGEIRKAIMNNKKINADKGKPEHKGLTVKYCGLIPYMIDTYKMTKEETFAAIDELCNEGVFGKIITRAGAMLFLPEDFKAHQSVKFATLLK
jgi:hypothetical protein